MFRLRPRNLRPFLLVVGALACAATVESNASTEKTSGDLGLRLAVARSMPLVNRPQEIAARIDYRGKEPRRAVVEFFSRRDEDRRQPLGQPRSVELKPGGNELRVEHTWTPAQTGRYAISARVRPVDAEAWPSPPDAVQTVTVVGRPLHFHYWHIHPSLRYVTQGLTNDGPTRDLLTDRGIIAQHWKGGIHTYKTTDVKTPEKFARYWLTAREGGWPGVVIDEFGGGPAVDAILGQGLLEAKRQRPDCYLAVYAIAVGQGSHVEAFRQAADVVLVETYESSASADGYRWIETRYGQAVEERLGAKALTVLGLGKFGITTPQELRRQLHFARYTFPDMPGIAFFGGFTPLYPALNDLLERFYVGPVLRVETTDDGQLAVQNIGAQDAPSTPIRLKTADGRAVSRQVPPLAVGQQHRLPASDSSLTPLSNYTGRCVVLGPPQVWDKEPAAMRPGATDAWPADAGATPCFRENFDVEPPLKRVAAKSDEQAKGDKATKKDAKETDLGLAYFETPSTGAAGCQLTFDLNTERTWFYGSLSIRLVDRRGKSLARLGLYRGDHQPAASMQLSLCNTDGVATGERIALPIESPREYRVKLRYSPEGYVRVAILDAQGQTLWDTGRVPTYGKLTFDRLCFAVRQGEGWKLGWDAQSKSLRLRGTQSPEYVMAALVDNIELLRFDAER